MDDNLIEKQSSNTGGELDGMFKSGNAFRFFSAFEKSKAVEIEEDGETRKYIEFDASSDQEDLAGDVMTLSALKEMQASAEGTIMLRNHKRDTENIFGSITEAKIVKENGVQILRMRAWIDEEDKENIRIWKSIQKGVKLGASVTVIILGKDINPNRKNGLIISSVKLLEVSIVTIPCNQQSWTLAATASKALQLAEAVNQNLISDESEKTETVTSVVAEINTKTIEENMSEQTNQTAAPVAGEESKSILTRTLAAVKAHEDRKTAAETSKTAPEVLEVTTKGLFAEEQAKRQPTLWDLFDILYSVKYQLMDRKWAMEWIDIEGVSDDYDYVGEYNVACQEFAEAAVKSFVYYGGFDVSADTAAGADGDGVTDEIISNALDIQKSFDVFAELFQKSAADNKPTLQSIGDELVALASKAGINLGRSESADNTAAPEVTDDVIRKSEIFAGVETRAKDAETRAEVAEKQVGDLETELEVAKAGLETAAEAIELLTRQPLHIEKR